MTAFLNGNGPIIILGLITLGSAVSQIVMEKPTFSEFVRFQAPVPIMLGCIYMFQHGHDLGYLVVSLIAAIFGLRELGNRVGARLERRDSSRKDDSVPVVAKFQRRRRR